ncbi:hypothetical protein B0J18DRAFT_130195 [Chaetomium sp. MPI-SDFR-AT-0129]|nr:hypothetical protein B0J18DRAFT_130195 [Chaetomium sp. MPI-SDFR-AT-0129]
MYTNPLFAVLTLFPSAMAININIPPPSSPGSSSSSPSISRQYLTDTICVILPFPPRDSISLVRHLPDDPQVPRSKTKQDRPGGQQPDKTRSAPWLITTTTAQVPTYFQRQSA